MTAHDVLAWAHGDIMPDQGSEVLPSPHDGDKSNSELSRGECFVCELDKSTDLYILSVNQLYSRLSFCSRPPASTMSLGDPYLLPALYAGLATPPLSPAITSSKRSISSPLVTPNHSVPPTPVIHSPTHSNSRLKHLTVDRHDVGLDHDNGNRGDIDDNNDIKLNTYTSAASPPIGSLLPTKLPQFPHMTNLHLARLNTENVGLTDSLARDKKGKMPALSHLLSVGDGRVLSLAADDQYVYAGCQSENNEIVVGVLFRLSPPCSHSHCRSSRALRCSPNSVYWDMRGACSLSWSSRRSRGSSARAVSSVVISGGLVAHIRRRRRQSMSTL